MNIGLDMMGGDFAPLEACKGVARYFQENHDNLLSGKIVRHLYLFGQSEVAAPKSHIPEEYASFYSWVECPEIIGYHEHPTKALKEKQRSSISIGFHYLATGKIDAFISAGNTGAMLVGAMYSIKPISGLSRPTIATVLPKIDGSTGLLLDVGLNADCKPEHLLQFATLANIYAAQILGIQDPKVALLNIGEEEGKGNLLAQAAYTLFKENNSFNFIGNVEGRDLFGSKADVYVCDGFTGNIVLKMAESIYEVAQARGLAHDAYFKRFHYENYGGTPVLGVHKPVIIGHGISESPAFSNMILLAAKMIESAFCEKIQAAFSTE
jgi:glycerol-3-phosphate acyltransferase PlsX